MIKPVREQVIVIAGASSGIGRLTALEAARRGARVVVAARNERELEGLVAEITSVGGSALAVPTDVADYQQVQALAQCAADTFGRIDTWVNNAAVSLYGKFKDVPVEDMRRLMDINFMGQVHGAKVALPYLEESAGALICVGSTLSDRGVPLQTAYCASKHAVKGWLDGLRLELRHEGSPVRVVLIKPSSLNTPLFEKARTYMGVEPQPIAPVYAPELAVEAILHAAESEERDVFVGAAGKVLSLGERISPKLVDLEQLWAGFSAQETHRPKSPHAPHNLYAPVVKDGGERGALRAEEKQRSLYQPLEEHSVVASFAAAALLALGAVAAYRGSRRGGIAAALAIPAVLFAGKGALAATFEG